MRFVASIFALAGHELGDATIKTHLNKVRAGRQSGQHDTERGAPVIFDSQLEWRREFYIANVMDLDPNLNRKHGEALWDELLTGTHGFFQDNTQ